MTPDAVFIEGLSKRFKSPAGGEVWALREVSFRLERGSILLLTGKNGSGKTTLLKILATLILPTSGSVLIHGCDILRSPLAAGSRGVVLADDRSLYWRLTGKENLEFYGALYGLSGKRIKERISLLKKPFGLDFLDRPLYTYSVGMRQRVSLACALVHDAPILLLDEPARSLDPDATAALAEWLVRERDHAKTIILMMQKRDGVFSSDLVGTLEKGRLRSVLQAGS